MKKDFGGLTTLIADLSALGAERDIFLRRSAQVLAQLFLREVKRRTPVGARPEFDAGDGAAEYWRGYAGGSLRRAWTVRGVRRVGGQWTAVISNPLEYASYVENGHRQTPGRYVPALGRRLKRSWVEGRFMMKLSAEKVEKDGIAYVRAEMEKFLRRHWNGRH